MTIVLAASLLIAALYIHVYFTLYLVLFVSKLTQSARLAVLQVRKVTEII